MFFGTENRMIEYQGVQSKRGRQRGSVDMTTATAAPGSIYQHPTLQFKGPKMFPPPNQQ